MARVLCIDDFIQYSEMVAMLLSHKGGHETLPVIVPLDLTVIERFKPDVVVLNLVRKVEALGEPLVDFYAQVDGARAYRAIAEHRELSGFTLVLTSIAVLEVEVPKLMPYLAFVDLPSKIDNLLHVVERAAEGARRRVAPE